MSSRKVNVIKLSAFLIVFAIIFVSPISANAFKLSPCLRILVLKDGKLSQDKVRWFNQCKKLDDQYKSAVHDHMTLATIRKYRGDGVLEKTPQGWKYNYTNESPWSKDNVKYHRTHAIIYGTWWNDDPLMRTWGQGKDLILGAYSDSLFLKSGPTYPGGTLKCDVKADQHLGRWSHFGKLQHLHFMTEEKKEESSPDYRVQSTTELALKWLAFTYKVAIDELKPSDHLTPETESQLNLPSIALNECVSPENVKIQTLFSRIGWESKYRAEMTPDVALGSMLHLIQDSWSPAHTCRVETRNKDKSPIAAIKDVYNYSEQLSEVNGEKNHSKLDHYPQWLINSVAHNRTLYGNDPIVTGAWLLDAVDQKKPWSEVEKYFRETVFVSVKLDENETNPCIN